MTKVHKLIAGSLLVGSLAGAQPEAAGQRPDQERTGDELGHLRHPAQPVLVAAGADLAPPRPRPIFHNRSPELTPLAATCLLSPFDG
ncbi:hypothetical protein, partial [Mycobacterium avium]|uniref:hypothetical protein n=1 Tax=Mycobacterium avium TaxID=1764 RepID=UPI001E45319E